jgi:hypothetical protein
MMPSRVSALSHRVAGPLLLVLLPLSACNGDVARTGGPEWLRSSPEPVQLALTLDSARATTRIITPRGGSITVTASDGTRYRLRIPRDALLGNAEITMTPVASVRGLPLGGGGLAAVQLEPDGLRLMQPATLSIDSDHEVPIEEQVAYGFFGDGEDAHLYPLEMDGRRIEMKLLHFSGYGFGRAAPDDPGRRMLRRAASYEARVSAELAEAIGAERSRQILGTSDPAAFDLGEMSSRVFIDYYDEILRPMMTAAESDERLAECCLTRYFSWMRQIILLGGAPDPGDPATGSGTVEPGTVAAELRRRIDEGNASAERIWNHAYEKAREREIRLCREEHDFASIQRLLSVHRSMILLGLLPEGSGADIFDAIADCLNFEVEFRSIFDNRGPAGVQFYYHVSSRVTVEVSPVHGPENGALGSAPLEYQRYDARGSPRQALIGETMEGFWPIVGDHSLSANGARPGQFHVHAIGWEWNVIDSPATDCDGRDTIEKRDVADGFNVLISFGAPTEITRNAPTGRGLSAGAFDTESQAWSRHWSQAHGHQRVRVPGLIVPDEDEDGGLYRIELEAVRAGGVWRVDFKQPDPGVDGWSLAEDGYLILRHTPG